MLELTGTVENGAIRLDHAETLPEGTKVRIVVPDPQPSIWSKLLDVAGTVTDMPADASSQIDHYLYGHPKR